MKMPSVSDLLDTHPLIGVLPAVVRAPLLLNTKGTVKGYGTTLYMEGSRATGIWIVSTGVVKWASQRLSSMYSLDPILSHGSTLGLYEVLTGKSYICDMITNSLVHCFFIEAEKVDQLRRSDPSVEALVWQESALVVAKLLIPRIFERITTHETRLLIAKGSTMKIYTKGEDIALEHNQIGILLEGLLKAENQNNIVSPGVLLPSNMDLELLGLQSSAMNLMDHCYPANSYQVQARVRVIIFEAGRLLAEANLQRSSPLLTLSGEHGGLLSWPENSQESTSLAATRNQQGSLSAKALHLGLYGSMEESTEEEIIVTIDSPSKLSLGKSPGTPQGGD